MAKTKQAPRAVGRDLVDRVYSYLSKRKTPISVAKLAERFGRTPNTIYLVMRALKAQGTKLAAERNGRYVAYRIK